MTKDIRATRYEFGSKKFTNVILRVPNQVDEAFKDCNIQIVDYPNQDTVVFLCKDGHDIDSVTIKSTSNNFSHAIKRLYERVKEEQ